MRRWRTRPAITRSGSMPTTWSSRREREKLERFSGACGPATRPRYVVHCACDPGPDGTGGETVVDHIRLFPLRPRCSVDLSRPRADPAVAEAGQGAGALDRPDRAAHRLCRPGAAGQEARPRHQDPQARAGRAARRTVRALQPGVDRRRAARWHEALGFLEAQPGRLGADRLDRAQAVCPDRPRAPDDWEIRRRRCATCAEGLEARPRGRRIVVPQGGGAPAPRRIDRRRAAAGGGS